MAGMGRIKPSAGFAAGQAEDAIQDLWMAGMGRIKPSAGFAASQVKDLVLSTCH
jgi:hypothetical protein